MNKYDYIEERVLEVAEYIIKNNATVREAAEYFGVSKSTIHLDATERLPRIDGFLAEYVRTILDTHIDECAERMVAGRKKNKKDIVSKKTTNMLK